MIQNSKVLEYQYDWQIPQLTNMTPQMANSTADLM
jgi:hypothetical protein